MGRGTWQATVQEATVRHGWATAHVIGFLFFFFKTYCYCIFKRLQYNINITFTGTGKPQNLCDLLYCNICFIVLVWNLTHNIYKVCLYHLFKYCSNPFGLFFHFSSSIFIPYYCISSILYPLFCIFCLSVPLDAEFRIIYPVLFPKYKIGIQWVLVEWNEILNLRKVLTIWE